MVAKAELIIAKALKERENEQGMYHHFRAKLVASILTDNGHPVTAPSVLQPLDAIEQARWDVCVEIEKVMSET